MDFSDNNNTEREEGLRYNACKREQVREVSRTGARDVCVSKTCVLTVDGSTPKHPFSDRPIRKNKTQVFTHTSRSQHTFTFLSRCTSSTKETVPRPPQQYNSARNCERETRKRSINLMSIVLLNGCDHCTRCSINTTPPPNHYGRMPNGMSGASDSHKTRVRVELIHDHLELRW